MDTLRVLAFSDVALPEGSGGVERQIEEIYGRWVEAGAAEVLLLALGDRSLPARDVRRGVRIARASQLSLAKVTGMQAAVSWSIWPLAFRAARVFRPDVVHAHTLFYATSLAAAAVARRENLPLALTAHIGSLDALPEPQRTVSRLYASVVGRQLVREADLTVCVGESVRDYIEDLAGDGTRLRVVPNGVDGDRFHPGLRQEQPSPGEPLVVASVGRLIFNKGHHDVIEAVRTLAAEGHRLELRIAGDGPMRQELEQRAGDLVARGIVSFLGHREDVEAVLRDSDAFVRASMTESMPMAVLEAMATGLPTIATDVGSVSEILVNGESGMLVPPANPARLSDALRLLIMDPPLRRELGAAARRTAEDFGWEVCAAGTLAAVRETLEVGHAGTWKQGIR